MKTYTLEQFKKFATEIEAYENGEQIQALYIDEWQDCLPKWDVYCKYRVKPKLSRKEITANWVKENNLKIGDKVKVLKGFEKNFGGIPKGSSDGAIGEMGIVSKIGQDSIYFEVGCWTWQFPVECLEKIKEEYIPFCVDDFSLFRDKWVRLKDATGSIQRIIGMNIPYKSINLGNDFYSLDRAFEVLEFLDGTPFGKLKL